MWNFSREVKLVPALHLFKTSYLVFDFRYISDLGIWNHICELFTGFSWHLVFGNLYFWFCRHLAFGILQQGRIPPIRVNAQRRGSDKALISRLIIWTYLQIFETAFDMVILLKHWS